MTDLGEILSRFGGLALYTVGIAFITYLVNVFFNFAQLIVDKGKGALSHRPNITHAFLLDQTAALRSQLPVYVIPLVILGYILLVATISLIGTYRSNTKQLKGLLARKEVLKEEIREYRRMPTPEGKQTYERNLRELDSINDQIRRLVPTERLEQFDQIKTLIAGDKKLMDLTDSYIRRKRLWPEIRSFVAISTAATIVSRLLVILLSN
jgi:hypothetical protein